MNEELLACFYSLYNVYNHRYYDKLSFLKLSFPDLDFILQCNNKPIYCDSQMVMKQR